MTSTVNYMAVAPNFTIDQSRFTLSNNYSHEHVNMGTILSIN